MNAEPEVVDAEVVEAEVVEDDASATGGTLVRHPTANTAITLFRTEEPEEVVIRATKTATTLAAVIERQVLFSRIENRKTGEVRKYVRVEGWTLLGSMLGVFPVLLNTERIEKGWKARVEARTRDGAVIGAGEAICTRAEKRWEYADDYAILSMSQTRATSKAMRLPLSFVMTLAGYEPTPAEEMAEAKAEAAPREPKSAGKASGKLASLKQVRFLYGLGKERYSDAEMSAELGVASLKALAEGRDNPVPGISSEIVRQFIERWKGGEQEKDNGDAGSADREVGAEDQQNSVKQEGAGASGEGASAPSATQEAWDRLPKQGQKVMLRKEIKRLDPGGSFMDQTALQEMSAEELKGLLAHIREQTH